ncbi:MAG: M48 family metallopeptidase [Alphaproteobacteria bacterium]|nr:M48 family metallopeptidase [Alphaproteobacteria bacterium]
MLKSEIEISGIKIFLTQKKIRNLHLRILPPSSEVRVSAPLRFSLEKIEEFVLKRIDWIKNGQNQIRKLHEEGKIEMPPKFLSGEKHEFLGKKFEFELIRNSSANKLIFSAERFVMTVKGQSNFAQRQKLMDNFYRKNLQEMIPQMIEKYEKKMGVKVAEFGIKKMKTRWGTCNVRARRIWLGLELAKKPAGFLESIVVHEMVHFLEQKHSKRFYELMDRFMPKWRITDAEVKGKIID